MGRNIPAGQEAQALRRLIRDAHAAAKKLDDAIRQADRLADRLVADFEAIHAREIKQLSNHFTEESNRHAASLNADVEEAKRMIFNEIMAGELRLDPAQQFFTLRLGTMRFDEHQPLPYPSTPPKESTT